MAHLEKEQLLLRAPEKRMFEHAGGGGAGLGLRTDHVLDQIQSDCVIWKERKKERINLCGFLWISFQTHNCVWIRAAEQVCMLPSVLNVHVRMLDCKALDFLDIVPIQHFAFACFFSVYRRHLQGRTQVQYTSKFDSQYKT